MTMPFDTKTLIKDANGSLIPQYFSDSADAYEPAKGKNGAVFVSAAQADVKDVTFHDAATAPGKGVAFSVGGYKTLTVEIYGTSTSRTINFKATLVSGAEIPIMGVKLSDMSMSNNTSGTGEIWQFDVTGLNTVIMDLVAVSGGNVSIKGKAVA